MMVRLLVLFSRLCLNVFVSIDSFWFRVVSVVLVLLLRLVFVWVIFW